MSRRVALLVLIAATACSSVAAPKKPASFGERLFDGMLDHSPDDSQEVKNIVDRCVVGMLDAAITKSHHGARAICVRNARKLARIAADPSTPAKTKATDLYDAGQLAYAAAELSDPTTAELSASERAARTYLLASRSVVPNAHVSDIDDTLRKLDRMKGR